MPISPTFIIPNLGKTWYERSTYIAVEQEFTNSWHQASMVLDIVSW
jgi:hypothetical protein